MAAAIGDLVVHRVGVAALAEVVAHQVEDHAGLVRIAHRHVARCLHPEIDIGIDRLVPEHLDDDVAGWRLPLALLLVLLGDMSESDGADHQIGEYQKEQHVAEGDIHSPPHGLDLLAYRSRASNAGCSVCYHTICTYSRTSKMTRPIINKAKSFERSETVMMRPSTVPTMPR